MSTIPQLLLCTDLDRTLLPNGVQPESSSAREAFRRLAAHPSVTLVYVSGRDRGRIERAINCYQLPLPALAVGDVGTSIYDLRCGRWQSVAAWQEEISRDWKGLGRDRLAASLASLNELRLQELTKQNTYKLSYYLPLHLARDALDAEITKRLQRLGIAFSLVWSVDEPAGLGLLDVLPGCATKLHAVQFVRELLAMPISQTV